MISDTKWKRLYKALDDIRCKRRAIAYDPRLDHIWYKDGIIYATNAYVAVRVEFLEPLQVTALDPDTDPAEGVSYEIGKQMGIAESMHCVPDIDSLFCCTSDDKECLDAFNPLLMEMICDVYKALDLRPRMFGNGNNILEFHAQNEDVEVRAILMGVRV